MRPGQAGFGLGQRGWRLSREGMRRGIAGAIAALVLVGADPARAGEAAHYTAPQMFELAGAAAQQGDAARAETIYRALEKDPDRDIRCEARFRHALLREQDMDWTAAALLLRAILDERPMAQPARLELAKVLATMGREGAARRELRAAQAGGLPPDVARAVNQFAAALRSTRPFGGSVELGFSPSTNVNRATSSPTLNSVLGPLDLSRDAQAQSGIGLSLGGQGTAQVPVAPDLALTARLSTQNTLYRSSQFDDSTLAGDAGAALTLGASRLRLSLGPAWRFYGGHPYTFAANASLDWLRPLGRRTQLDLQTDFSRVRYRTNRLQDGLVIAQSVAIERAFDARTGARLALFAQRTTAADPGYALVNGGGSVLIWREWGKTTVYATAGVSRLEADARLFLYTDRRREWLVRGGIGATFRALAVGGFAPLVRINVERNASTVGIYGYHRVGADIALTRAF